MRAAASRAPRRARRAALRGDSAACCRGLGCGRVWNALARCSRSAPERPPRSAAALPASRPLAGFSAGARGEHASNAAFCVGLSFGHPKVDRPASAAHRRCCADAPRPFFRSAVSRAPLAGAEEARQCFRALWRERSTSNRARPHRSATALPATRRLAGFSAGARGAHASNAAFCPVSRARAREATPAKRSPPPLAGGAALTRRAAFPAGTMPVEVRVAVRAQPFFLLNRACLLACRSTDPRRAR